MTYHKEARKKENFIDVFPDLKTTDIANLLYELKMEGKIKHEGKRRSGHWTPIE